MGLGTEVTVNELLDVLLEVVAVGDDVEGVTGAADEVTGEVLLELGEPGEDELEAVPLPLLCPLTKGLTTSGLLASTVSMVPTTT